MTCGGSRKSLFIRLEGMLYLKQRCQRFAKTQPLHKRAASSTVADLAIC